MPIIIAIAIALWLIFGDPLRTVAGMFWPNDPAPWERVDASYYPDRRNLVVSVDRLDVGGLDACRRWVQQRAAERGDPLLVKGDYECGVGYIRNLVDIRVCRLTMR